MKAVDNRHESLPEKTAGFNSRLEAALGVGKGKLAAVIAVELLCGMADLITFYPLAGYVLSDIDLGPLRIQSDYQGLVFAAAASAAMALLPFFLMRRVGEDAGNRRSLFASLAIIGGTVLFVVALRFAVEAVMGEEAWVVTGALGSLPIILATLVSTVNAYSHFVPTKKPSAAASRQIMGMEAEFESILKAFDENPVSDYEERIEELHSLAEETVRASYQSAIAKSLCSMVGQLSEEYGEEGGMTGYELFDRDAVKNLLEKVPSVDDVSKQAALDKGDPSPKATPVKLKRSAELVERAGYKKAS